MQRKKFLQLSVLGAAAIGFTGINCQQRLQRYYKVLGQPLQLSRICDAWTIREIGVDYLLQSPGENDPDRLADFLLKDSVGNAVLSASDSTIFQTLIDQNIKHDFESGKMVTVKGWILSVTEARQCALYSVNNP